MALPTNISKEHLIKAIEKIEKDGFPNDADSQYYNVLFNGKIYPPKVIVSYANIFANGIELNRNSFSGGLNTECFKLLEKNGFEIIKKEKMSYYNELKRFLDQSMTNDLRTSANGYLREYNKLKVKVSFGQGAIANIPWISFLREGQTTQNGIYPVYLYFKAEKILVLAYGISVTNEPNKRWDLKNPKTISEYFEENKIGIPFNYGNSFIFKTYNIDNFPSSDVIDSDLNEILSYYNSLSLNENPKPGDYVVDFNINSFYQKTQEAGLIFSQQLIQRFVASLCTKPFVICSGLSGSGKTKLAQAFAQWISSDKSQYEIVPVGADWTNREPLLGYPNTLNKLEYVSPENGVLDLMIRAKQNIENIEEPTKPYFLILDEMNLSHVERYFADFLSTMESGDKIPLHKIENNSLMVPSSIKLPKNLFIVGTVNIDETTYMFSPKVLDRANTIEFRLTEKDLADFIASDIKLDMDLLKAQGSNMSDGFMAMALKETEKNLKPTEADLKLFFSELKKSGAEFGYRTASEIGRLMHMLKELGESGDNLLDIAIMQKLLPKLHGSRSKLNTALTTLAKFCVEDAVKDFDGKDEDFRKIYFTPFDKLPTDSLDKIKYKISFEKISRMHKNAMENGFTSYAEA